MRRAHLFFKTVIIIFFVIGIYSCGKKSQNSGSFVKQHIGESFKEPPKISHILSVDLDQDSLLDVIVCDVQNDKIGWIRQEPLGTFKEYVLAKDVLAPSHAQAIDFDSDGDLDLIISLLGMLLPNNDKIGSIVILENDGQESFTRHIIIEKIYRVSDVRAGDLDGDGDLDLAATQFGYVDGETCWLENKGDWIFEYHTLQKLAGGINCELADIDNDSDLDIITVVSQEWEEIYLFRNEGKGVFNTRLLNGLGNDDFGSSGISLFDLDQDGDLDILYTNGDAFDYVPPKPRPWHGVNWLENKSNYTFEFNRIAPLGGAYNARAGDYDKDGDIDIIAVSAFNLWENEAAQSIVWLENDGNMKFVRHNIDNNPTHILALDSGDFNNDGTIDFVTGGMHVQPPFDRLARVMLWTDSKTNTNK